MEPTAHANAQNSVIMQVTDLKLTYAGTWYERMGTPSDYVKGMTEKYSDEQMMMSRSLWEREGGREGAVHLGGGAIGVAAAAAGGLQRLLGVLRQLGQGPTAAQPPPVADRLLLMGRFPAGGPGLHVGVGRAHLRCVASHRPVQMLHLFPTRPVSEHAIKADWKLQ